MKSLYVYILLCADETYYVGVTNNLKRRISEHQSGYNPESYTAQRLPIKLVYHEYIHGPLTAIKREKQLKNWTHEKKKALIEGRIDDLKKLAKKDFG